jgi:hypothetical protein
VLTGRNLVERCHFDRNAAVIEHLGQRRDAAEPPLADVRDQVEQQLLEKLADDWLKLRLRELRAEFDIVLPERRS